MTPVAIDVQAGRIYWWCRCGHSKLAPFCDGAHRGSDSSPLKYTATADGVVWFCVCRRTRTPPCCDGSHHDLNEP